MKSGVVEQGKFVCPEPYEEICVEGLCIEDVKDEDHAIWQIQAPIDADILKLNGQNLVTDGSTQIQQGDHNYDTCATEAVSTKMQFQLALPSRTKSKMIPVYKEFEGLLTIAESTCCFESDNILKSPNGNTDISNGSESNILKSGESYDVSTEPIQRKRNRSRKHRTSKTLEESAPIGIKFENPLDTYVDSTFKTPKKRNSKHKHHKSFNNSGESVTDYNVPSDTFEESQNVGVSPLTEHQSIKKVKKEKKRKADMLSDTVEGEIGENQMRNSATTFEESQNGNVLPLTEQHSSKKSKKRKRKVADLAGEIDENQMGDSVTTFEESQNGDVLSSTERNICKKAKKKKKNKAKEEM